MNIQWWIVMIPGDYAETSDIHGPFRSEGRAQEVVDRWNAAHPNELAHVLPIMPVNEMRAELSA